MMNFENMILHRITRHALLVPLALGMAYASPLDDRIKTFRDAAAQKEADVIEILHTGLAEGRSAEAFAAVKPWLADNAADSTRFLFLAAQSAEFAGEWRQAVNFYRKLAELLPPAHQPPRRCGFRLSPHA